MLHAVSTLLCIFTDIVDDFHLGFYQCAAFLQSILTRFKQTFLAILLIFHTLKVLALVSCVRDFLTRHCLVLGRNIVLDHELIRVFNFPIMRRKKEMESLA